ncbi:hypothetical protein [Lysobacter sp. HA35]
MRRSLVIALAVVAVGWWFSPIGPSHHRARAAEAVGAVSCPMPPSVAAFGEPLQSEVRSGVGPFRLRAATLQPLAGFSVDARVLSREDYSMGRESDLSPTDLALGWGRMRDDSVLKGLDISQSGRWYMYRWRGDPPIPADEIVRSSANMHMIPANLDAASALADVHAGDRVRIDGWLVEADAPDGWTWRSSMSRDDSGDGACEVIYVCSLRRVSR